MLVLFPLIFHLTFPQLVGVTDDDDYRPMNAVTHSASAAENMALDQDIKSELYPTIRIMRTSMSSQVTSVP
jgi:hypothetical protein